MRLSPDRRSEWVSGSVAGVLGWAAPDLVDHAIDEFVHQRTCPGSDRPLLVWAPSLRRAAEVKEQQRLGEFEQFQPLTVGRELKMIELLRKKNSGQPKRSR